MRRSMLVLDRDVLGERHFLRRGAFVVLPGGERDAVAALVVLGAADGQDGEALVCLVHKLSPNLGSDAGEGSCIEGVRRLLDEERQRSIKDEVDLLLAAV